MTDQSKADALNLLIANRWCQQRGLGWSVIDQAGRGGTAPVFALDSPDGPRALKIYDEVFSTGAKGVIEERRIEQQKQLGNHDCEYLVKVYDGGRFEDRLFLLMSRAPGFELEKHLKNIPREGIRAIVDAVARACLFLKEKGLCHRDIKSANIFISDDFKKVTLLDLSVMRDIHDPVGIGTDHGEQLPVVATARYSPPEYLFRLLEPSEQLWHAVDIYQLGALLHDLIMREPLFEKQYQQSKENRYRFAWTVATVCPIVAADDVDFDLVMLARNALDKDWKKRSQLRIDDFLSDAAQVQKNALIAIGFSREAPSLGVNTTSASQMRRVQEVASQLEAQLKDHLRENGVTASHDIDHADSDNSKIVRLEWEGEGLDGGGRERFKFEIAIQYTLLLSEGMFSVTAVLSSSISKKKIGLPDVPDGNEAVQCILDSAKSALGRLAELLVRDSK